MKLSCIPVLLFLLFFVPTQAQWYVETAVTNNRLAAYSLTGTNATSITPTKVDSFKGFRDTSYGFGYLFSFHSIEERMADDYQTPFFRLGIGLGFEQMNLKTNAIINSAAYPNVYSMAQAQSRLGAYLSPLFLFAKQSIGNKLPQPKFSLDIHGGLGYNYYTSAEQHFGNTLRWDGTAWVESAALTNDGTDVQITGALKDSSGDKGSAGQILSSTASGTNWISDHHGVETWASANAYAAGDVVIHNNKIYQANGAVTAGTGFSVGTSGATWT